MGIELQIFWVLSWILTLKFLQLALWPALKRTFHHYAYPVSFSASVLLFTLLTWYCGYIGISLFPALLPFLGLLSWNLYTGAYHIEDFRENFVWDALFLTGFLFVLMIRVTNPSISYAEKFMDHAFLASIMRDPVVPPLDPWFAGGTLSIYYYLGYWMFGALGLVTGVSSPVVFNLALPTVFGLTLVNGYLLGCLLLERLRWLPLAAFFLVNPSFLYNLILGKSLSSVLWDSTRTISNTINEYPLFSVLWGDVHPHVMNLFNQVFLLALLIFAYYSWERLERVPRMLLVFLCALSLGSMPLLNSWDVLVYAPIAVLFGILIWYRTKRERIPFGFLAIIPPLAILLYFPYYLMADTSGIKGIFPVPTPSDPAQYFLVHGFFLVILLVVCRKDIFRRPYLLLLAVPFLAFGLYAAVLALIPLIYLSVRRSFTPAEIITMIGLAIIIFPEILYLKDSFGDPYYRMNTVFKLYYAGWILMGTGSLTLLAAQLKGWVFPHLPVKSSLLAIVLAILLILSPLAMGLDFSYGGGTLDGMAYLDHFHPSDVDAISFLRSQVGEFRIVEAENGDYTYYSRVSAFTGIPAVIGWPYHEITWRGPDVGIMERTGDVRAIYEQPDRSLSLMEKYNATYLYVGDSERERYTVNLPKEGLTPVYNQSGVTIYKRMEDLPS